MLEIFSREPWLIVVCMALLIPICGIVFGTIGSYLRYAKQAELDASLKNEMLQRGMSADEIKTVVEAGRGRKMSRACGKRSEVDV